MTKQNETKTEQKQKEEIKEITFYQPRGFASIIWNPKKSCAWIEFKKGMYTTNDPREIEYLKRAGYYTRAPGSDIYLGPHLGKQVKPPAFYDENEYDNNGPQMSEEFNNDYTTEMMEPSQINDKKMRPVDINKIK